MFGVWGSLAIALLGCAMMAFAGPTARARVRWEQRLLGRPYKTEELTRRFHFLGGLLVALGGLLSLYLSLY